MPEPKAAITVCKIRRRRKRKREKSEKKTRFLLMNKGNFIFCFSFRTTLATLY
jgi:hypothetical protein